MASFADKATGPIKAKKLTIVQEEQMREIFKSEKKGQSFVNSETKLNEERKLLNNKYPGELNKFVFGNIKDLSEEYVKELFDLYKKFKKTEAKNLNDFLTEIQ